MNLDFLAIMGLGFAAIPAGLFLANLQVYRPLKLTDGPEHGRGPDSNATEVRTDECARISVLIPARNEERNLRATLEAALANRGADFEVVVLDDHSTDRTPAIVSDIAARDARVRLESAPPLPAGWCGKQHACQILAEHARNPLLVFIDADVRLAPDALVRMAKFMDGNTGSSRTGACALPGLQAGRNSTGTNRVALASGVPRQELGTFSERLLLPLIHFILLCYLPMHAMRRSPSPAFSAGCGQLFITWRDAYFAAGGHAAIRATLHDGVKLPRSFRLAGFHTDLFDATDVATCRMYLTNSGTWQGLGKNATEGLAAPATILPMTVLLLGGQVMPLVLLGFTSLLSPTGVVLVTLAAALSFLPRLLGVALFGQPFGSAVLHPVGVVALLLIQWHALARFFLGRPAHWKGRHYPPVTTPQTTKTA